MHRSQVVDRYVHLTIDYSLYLFRVILFAVAHLAKFFVNHPFLILSHSTLLRLLRWQRRQMPGGPLWLWILKFFHVVSNCSWHVVPEYPHFTSFLHILLTLLFLQGFICVPLLLSSLSICVRATLSNTDKATRE